MQLDATHQIKKGICLNVQQVCLELTRFYCITLTSSKKQEEDGGGGGGGGGGGKVTSTANLTSIYFCRSDAIKTSMELF